jgi:hypothetical protein
LSRNSQAQRYRKAAELAIEQLDWCINYLHRIQRPRVAQALLRSRRAIVKRHRL